MRPGVVAALAFAVLVAGCGAAPTAVEPAFPAPPLEAIDEQVPAGKLVTDFPEPG